MPGPRAVQNLQMPHPRDWQGGQMPRSSPGGGGWAQVELDDLDVPMKKNGDLSGWNQQLIIWQT